MPLLLGVCLFLQDSAVNCTLRGAFEYQGQKCSATSRVYVSDKIWPEFRDRLVSRVKEIKTGQSDDFSVFHSAVIDKASWEKCKAYIEHAKAADDAEVIVGGVCDNSVGWFVEPTVIHTTNPHYKSMEEEIFGPILSIYVYNSSEPLEVALLVLTLRQPSKSWTRPHRTRSPELFSRKTVLLSTS
jgi:1-pyrroline-5-carboxylate dehydrogenase